MKKIFFTLGAFLMFSNSSFAAFSDLKADNSYYTSIKWMSDNGYVQGYSDSTFGINQNVTRAEFLKMLFNSSGESDDIEEIGEISNPVLTDNFSEFKKGDWFNKYVFYAKIKGTVNGYPDGTFGPNKNINRAEASKIIAKEFFGDEPQIFFEGLEVNETGSILGCVSHYLADIDAQAWYRPYMIFLHDRCIIPDLMIYIPEGPYDASVNPEKFMTRGDVAEMLYRAQMVKKNENKRFGLICGNGEKLFKSKIVDLSFCYPESFGTVSEKETEISPEAKEGTVNYIKSSDGPYLLMSVQSDDFKLLGDGDVGLTVDFRCLDKYKANEELKECFNDYDVVKSIEMSKILNNKTVFHAMIDASTVAGMRELNKYFIPNFFSEDYSINFDVEVSVEEGYEEEMLRVVETLDNEQLGTIAQGWEN